MKIIKTKLKDAVQIFFEPIKDERGFFMRVYDEKLFNDFGINKKWVQENHSKSVKVGVIRGFHLQLPPYSETKLIRCIRGRVLDVFVDLRKNSESFGKWDSVEISDEKFNAVMIPRGFGHAICTLEDNCEVIYKVDNWYSPTSEIGLLWNDEDLNVNWPVSNPVLSDKDKKNMSFKEFKEKIGGFEL